MSSHNKRINATKANRRPFPYFILGFFIPFLGAALAMFLRANALLEQNEGFVFSILYADAYYQYYPFFVDFRDILRSGGSLLYSWNVGMGTDYLGLFAYYVGSPLNWFSALIPEGWLLDYYTLLVPIRMGFAGMFFAIFLQKVFDKNDISIALFGSFYATCAWVTGYMWNTMWLDTFALLPLVVLGTYNVLRHRKFVLYTLSLFFSVFINYYIGYFTCIFTLLVFICYEVCNWRNFKKLLTDLGLMALFTVIAIGMTALLTLPTYAALRTANAGDSFSLTTQTFALNMTDRETDSGFLGLGAWLGLAEGMIKVAANSFAFSTPNYMQSSGLPNIYCGIFAFVFALLFVTCRQVKWRERICAALMLLFLAASFVIDSLNYIWHGFHNTNMIPYRFSFLYSFVLLYTAYRTWLLRRGLKLWQIAAALVAALVGLLLSPGMEEAAQVGGGLSAARLFPYVSLLLIALLGGALLLCRYEERLAGFPLWTRLHQRCRKLHLGRSLGSLALAAVISLELIFNIVAFGNQLPVQTIPDYPRSATDTAKAVAYMVSANGENSFYRAETAQHQSYNDGMLNGYNGISTFSSAANVKVTNYMKALGFSGQDRSNRFVYAESSPVSQLFLNLKYVIERRGFVENNPYFTDVYQSGRVHLMENNYYLPVGFMVDPQLKELRFDSTGSVFGFQNKLLSAALGREVTPWTIVPDSALSITSDAHITLSDIAGGACRYTLSENGYVSYTYTFESAGFFCVNYDVPTKNTYLVEHMAAGTDSWVQQHRNNFNGLSFIGSVCQVEAGDQVRITIQCKPGSKYKTLSLTGALLEEAVLQEAYTQLSEATLQVTAFEDTFVEGTVDCQKSGLLYTSIPQTNDNWKVYVDGKEAEITLIGDAMIGVILEEGSHTVTFRYENRAFNIGCIVSGCCAALFLGICAFFFKKKKAAKGS